MVNVRFFLRLLFLFFILTNNSFGKTFTNIIDLDTIFSKSTPGKSILDQLKENKKKMYENFNKKEEDLKIEENQIIATKNLVTDEEFLNKINDFKLKIEKYNISKAEIIKNHKKKRNQEIMKFIDLISPLLQNYMKVNSIDILIDKKNVFIVNSKYDITDKIISIINENIDIYKLEK
jgi:Skp family chaperone for outer membrane proteins